MPTQYVALLRGINVGGNNIIPMAALRRCFTDMGAKDVATYIQSGNVLFDGGSRSARAWIARIEAALSAQFDYEASVLVRSHAELRAVARKAPRGFGAQPDRFRYDVIFLKPPLTATKALKDVETHPGVDTVQAGPGVLYFSRVAARAAQSKLPRLVGRPVYQHMTLRNWRTTTTLLAMLDARGAR